MGEERQRRERGKDREEKEEKANIETWWKKEPLNGRRKELMHDLNVSGMKGENVICYERNPEKGRTGGRQKKLFIQERNERKNEEKTSKREGIEKKLFPFLSIHSVYGPKVVLTLK